MFARSPSHSPDLSLSLSARGSLDLSLAGVLSPNPREEKRTERTNACAPLLLEGNWLALTQLIAAVEKVLAKCGAKYVFNELCINHVKGVEPVE